VIPPGGEGQIKVTLRPKGTRTEISKNVVVLSNDPEQPQFTLTMNATLLVDMIAVPGIVSIANLAPGQPGTTSFSLQQTQGSDATVTSIRVQDTEHFAIQEIDTEPGSLATYEVRFSGRDDAGTSATRVTVETTGANTPQLTMRVRATAAYNLIYPKNINLTRGDDGQFERTIRITTRRGDPPKIGKVVDPAGLLDVEVLESTGPSVQIRLRVRDAAAAVPDERAAYQLHVHTNDPDEPELKLRYQIRAPRPPSRARVKGR